MVNLESSIDVIQANISTFQKLLTDGGDKLKNGKYAITRDLRKSLQNIIICSRTLRKELSVNYKSIKGSVKTE